MTVSILQGTPMAVNDGNVEPTDLSENRFFQRMEGTLSASVSVLLKGATWLWAMHMVV